MWLLLLLRVFHFCLQADVWKYCSIAPMMCDILTRFKQHTYPHIHILAFNIYLQVRWSHTIKTDSFFSITSNDPVCKYFVKLLEAWLVEIDLPVGLCSVTFDRSQLKYYNNVYYRIIVGHNLKLSDGVYLIGFHWKSCKCLLNMNSFHLGPICSYLSTFHKYIQQQHQR